MTRRLFLSLIPFLTSTAMAKPKTVTLTAVVTAYCPCKKCCGPKAPRQTASGKWPRQHHTIAGPRRFPFGSKVKVEGIPHTFTLEDRMSRRFPDRWDIYFLHHAEALKFGKKTLRVTVTLP